jgi:hypothetical protein
MANALPKVVFPEPLTPIIMIDFDTLQRYEKQPLIF